MEPLRKRCSDVAARRLADRAERREERFREEDGEHDEERRCQHLAYAIDDLVRIQCEIVGCPEENRRVDELSEGEIVLGEEGAYADLERDGTRTRHRKQRSDDEIEDNEQHRCKQRPRLCTQERHVFTARERDRRDAEQRQPDARRHEAEHCEQCVIARRLTERGREDEIARAEVDGKHHKTKRQEVFLFECVDGGSLQRYYTEITVQNIILHYYRIQRDCQTFRASCAKNPDFTTSPVVICGGNFLLDRNPAHRYNI